MKGIQFLSVSDLKGQLILQVQPSTEQLLWQKMDLYALFLFRHQYQYCTLYILFKILWEQEAERKTVYLYLGPSLWVTLRITQNFGLKRPSLQRYVLMELFGFVQTFFLICLRLWLQTLSLYETVILFQPITFYFNKIQHGSLKAFGFFW